MTALCIAGVQSSELKAVENFFLNAGMAAAMPLQRHALIDFAAWHQQVLSSDNLNRWDNGSNPPIGRLWEQVAGDLFLANLSAPLWGWADSQSLALLDYWAGFDSSVKFVLVCQSPEQAILEQITAGVPHQEIEEKLVEWQGLHTALLEFHRRQPARSTLVWADACMLQPASLLRHCANRWKLRLDPANAQKADHSAARRPISALGYYIASHLIESNTAAQQLKRELNSCVERLQGPGEGSASLGADLLSHLIDEYRALQAGRDVPPVSAGEGTQATAASHAGSLQAEAGQFEARLHELQLLATRLEQEKAALAESLAQAQHSLEEQRETQEAITDTLRQSQEENAKRLAEEIQARNSLMAQREVDMQRQADASARIRDIVKENDLLLVQLHQVQEALEECLRQQHDTQNQLLLADARWQRMLKRNPSYSDYERIERVQAGAGSDERITWRVHGLTIGPRIIPQLDFSTVAENGMAGLVFPREAANTGALLRWPGTGAQAEEILILPRGDNSVIRARAATIEQLSTSDAQMAWRLPTLVLSQLTATEAPLASGLRALQETLRRITVPLRYDEVILKREQVNPDYEHLWFVLKNAEVYGKHHGDFEFRLGCANLNGSEFGLRPKLEFPQSASTALEKWYAESNDDFGLKLELRFVLPQQFDAGVWRALSAHDQQFIKVLLGAVPRIIANLADHGLKFKRAPEAWQTMAVQMARVLRIQTKPAPQNTPKLASDALQDMVKQVQEAEQAESSLSQNQNEPPKTAVAPVHGSADTVEPAQSGPPAAKRAAAKPAVTKPRAAKPAKEPAATAQPQPAAPAAKPVTRKKRQVTEPSPA